MDTNVYSKVGAQNNIAVHIILSFRQICLVTVCLPLGGLIVCFITAYIFQQNDIHETHCRVYNIIPSISAITGISPQRYLWRICVAFHIGPRLLIASVYYAYYTSLLGHTTSDEQMKNNRLIRICYWLNIVEIAALCGVTYISNRENYPVHEKIFIVFMLCSLTYMLLTLQVFKEVHRDMTVSQAKSYLVKKILFITSIISTIGLLVFFAKHRLFCHKMAFSWFALCEYIIAIANMAFHVTVILDFPKEQLMIANGIDVLKSNSKIWKLN
ncbi:hypothetical protein AAG570_012980 [Ranatra chinensis]|uniref:CWH43-like N-terminal domain-containing protein n=1 Tax=Ranatra chinensis TaxID=642074 RepID=A0ABD0YFJ7_9HEMI